MNSPIVIAILGAVALGICAALLKREVKKRRERKNQSENE
jgi:hypothetical protein